MENNILNNQVLFILGLLFCPYFSYGSPSSCHEAVSSLRTKWPSYEEAQKTAQEANITTQKEYHQKYKELGGLPSHPNITYKEQWISWREFLGTTWPSYEEAQKIAQAANITTAKEYKQKYKELGLPSNPHITYKEWISWGEFLGTERIYSISWLSYEEAKKIAQEANITTQKEYLQKYKELGLPSSPHITYKEWISWKEFLGTGRIYSKSWPSYEEAQKIAQAVNITTAKEYFQKYKELGLPSNPNITYKEWISWREFLGTVRSWPSYKEAQKIASAAHITTRKEYLQKYKELGLPSNPNITYKEQWISWSDFLLPTDF